IVLRGSVSVERLEELLGVRIEREPGGSATTAAGLLNELAGHVPVAGETVVTPQVRFEVVDANQRKVLRLRARAVAAPPRESPRDADGAKQARVVSETAEDSAATRKAARATRSGK
ncbi:MAG TPA: transporter associated domain-containing protein, partial [Candidatus Acidoferrales bacterium]|nr:transporter associated domain-containing protein [Candidatus Acidoferrales bacterium]